MGKDAFYFLKICFIFFKLIRNNKTIVYRELIALGGADGQISVHYSDGRLERHWEGHCEGICLRLIEIDTNDCF